MTVDVELVTRKLLLIAGDLDTLLERAIGRMIDVNYHLITETGQPPPSDYYTSFVRLAELGVLDAAFARRLAPSAGLRNRLVHEHDEIDPSMIFDAVGSASVEIPAYIAAVERYLTGLKHR